MNEMKWAFTEPLETKDVLDDFEIDYAIQLPDDFRHFIERNNGGIPNKSVFDSPRKGMVLSNLLSFNKNGEETIYMALTHFEQNGKVRIIPFGTDGFGNFICLKDNEVVFWNHESGSFENVAKSLEEFLNMLHE